VVVPVAFAVLAVVVLAVAALAVLDGAALDADARADPVTPPAAAVPVFAEDCRTVFPTTNMVTTAATAGMTPLGKVTPNRREARYARTVTTTVQKLPECMAACSVVEIFAFDHTSEAIMMPKLMSVAAAAWSPRPATIMATADRMVI